MPNEGPLDVRRPLFAWRPVGLVAAALVVLLGATSNGYGYHRDELYFRLLGRHLAWGFVDQPPLTPALARLSTAVLGDHLWALRVPSLVCAALMAVGCALISREVGGGAAAQTLAALGAAAAYPLIGGHLLSTATVDVVIWLAVIVFMLRALLRDEPKWWLAVGVATGIGSYNKLLIFLLLVCVGLGLLLTDGRRLLTSRWVWLGLATALVIGAPNFAYQATHHWPQFSMAHALSQHKGHDARTQFVPLQLLLMGPPIVPIWVAGIVTLWRREATRAIAAAYPIMCIALLALAGQPYYTAGLLLALYAVGCTATVGWLAGRRWRAALVVVAVASNTVVSAFIALPLLTVAALAKTPIPSVNQTVRDQIGWPTYVREIAAVYTSLPTADRSTAIVLTGNYGEAGAIALYGRHGGLPAQVYSGQNQLWYLGAPPASSTVAVIVGIDDTAWIESQFASCETRGHLENNVDIDNEEQGRAIRVCRQPRSPWPTLWPAFRHLD